MYSTGMVYKGEFSSDVICGEGEMYYSPECKYQGSWVNGLVRIINSEGPLWFFVVFFKFFF